MPYPIYCKIIEILPILVVIRFNSLRKGAIVYSDSVFAAPGSSTQWREHTDDTYWQELTPLELAALKLKLKEYDDYHGTRVSDLIT